MTGISTAQFSDVLRRYRLDAGLSQEALAERAGLSTRGISDLERGINRTPQRETVLRLAGALALAGDERALFVAASQRRAVGSVLAERTERSLPAAVPVPLTPLLGRDEDVRALTTLLRHNARTGDPEGGAPAPSGPRLVTLTGPGGVGKTRLALAAAADLAAAYPDGVVFVSLAGLSDPTLVLAVLAQSAGIRAGGSRPLEEDLAARLHNKRLLIVVDNFEHVLPAAPDLARLLEVCPSLTMLVTSRARLRLRGEREVPVAPLALPDLQHLPPPAGLERYPALALFMERIREHHSAFALSAANAATVAEICTRLDGLPLALELAAAQIRMFSPRALLSRLQRPLDVLTGGPHDLPARQQTMRATITWSHDLLDIGDQILFRRLAVFAGSCTLDALEAFCRATESFAADVLERLGSLMDRNLLWQSEAGDGEPRFRMLETIREFGLARLSAEGELEAMRQAHAGVYLALAREAEPRLNGSEQTAWLARLEDEHDNLRAALRWYLQGGGVRELGLSLACSLGRFWEKRSHLSEGRQWLEQALAYHPQADTASRAAALNLLGTLAYAQGDIVRAAQAYQESLALRRVLGDSSDIARSLTNLGNVALEMGEYAQAVEWYEESLAISERSGNMADRATVLNNLGVVARAQGDQARALSLYEDCSRMYRALGDSWRLAVILTNLGNVASALGELERAQGLYRESLTMRRDLGDRQGMVFTLVGLGHLAHRQGLDVRAARLLAAAGTVGKQIGVALPASGLAEHEQITREIHKALGEQQCASAWAEGEAMNIERAIGYALDTAAS